MLMTKYITLDEFRDYFVDIDLRQALGSDESALAFITRIEDRMLSYIDSHFNRNVDREYPYFSEFQKQCYKKALLEQAIYVFRNGDISVDSGIDTDRGEVISRGRLDQASIAPNAINYLRQCGLWNRGVRKYSRGLII